MRLFLTLLKFQNSGARAPFTAISAPGVLIVTATQSLVPLGFVNVRNMYILIGQRIGYDPSNARH